jgi:hypothetical protein
MTARMGGNAEGPIVVGDLVEAIDTGETGRVRAIYEVKIEGGPPMPDMIHDHRHDRRGGRDRHHPRPPIGAAQGGLVIAGLRHAHRSVASTRHSCQLK